MVSYNHVPILHRFYNDNLQAENMVSRRP